MFVSQDLQTSVGLTENGPANGEAVASILPHQSQRLSSMIPAMRFSWEITNVDSVFSNGVARINDLTKEAMLQAIIDKDLRFLTVRLFLIEIISKILMVDFCVLIGRQ